MPPTFPPIGALTVLFDDLVDRDHDLETGEHNYLDYYDGRGGGRRTGSVCSPAVPSVHRASARWRLHRAILAGVAGFYLSVRAADGGYARPIRARLLNRSARRCGRSCSRCVFAAMAERGRPAYVAIITDGNGRWAKARGLPVERHTGPAPRTCARDCATPSSSGSGS